MNQRYRKQMRLRSRHARRGHSGWCNCPEIWDKLLMSLEKWKRKHGEFPVRRIRLRSEDVARTDS